MNTVSSQIHFNIGIKQIFLNFIITIFKKTLLYSFEFRLVTLLRTNKKMFDVSVNHNNSVVSEPNSYSRQINLHLTYSFQQHQQHKTSPIYIPQHTGESEI